MIFTFSSLSAVIPDGYVYEQKQKHNWIFAVQEDAGHLGYPAYMKCIGEVLYYLVDRGGLQSFNPLTKEPYYCNIETTEQESSLWLESTPVLFYKLTIRHKY